MASADHPHSFNWRQRPASSTSYVYPLKGILYALRTRHLWPLFRSRLVPVTILRYLLLPPSLPNSPPS